MRNILWANSFDSNRQCLKMKIRFLRNRYCRIVSFSKWNISFEGNSLFFFSFCFPFDSNQQPEFSEHFVYMREWVWHKFALCDVAHSFVLSTRWDKSFFTKLSSLDNAIHIVEMAELYISFENLYDSEHSPTTFTEWLNEWKIMAVLLLVDSAEICNFVWKSTD